MQDITVHIDASVVILCGKIDFGFQFVEVNAGELVLSDLDYTQRGLMNVTHFTSNKLTQVGINKITLEGSDVDNTLLTGPGLHIDVAQEFAPEANSKLEIVSAGSNYVAKK